MTQYYSNYDTIAAVSTPPGVGGIAVLRVSGENALDVSLKCLKKKHLHNRLATFAKIHHPETGDLVDEVVATFFAAPASYTGDDTVEISCHGGTNSAPAILDICRHYGARLALPGEFTRRAFLNGKMDLVQAEAVADLIHSTSNSASHIAARTLEGRLSRRLNKIRSDLTNIAAILELELDFVEEEIDPVPPKEHRKKIQDILANISELIFSFSSGRIQREGALIVIAGKPNAGKSSLLNALLEEDRAIISHIPGTTRDTIEESFEHRGILFRLADTAGLRESNDPLEVLGNRRAHHLIASCDLIVLLIDATERDPHFEDIIKKEYPQKTIIRVYNKIDRINEKPRKDSQDNLYISAKKLHGIELLKNSLTDKLVADYSLGTDTLAISLQRHLESLKSAERSLENALTAVIERYSNEFIAADVREAINHINDITGETTSEDVLNHIFSRFCIGK